jgi:hypothetical protein
MPHMPVILHDLPFFDHVTTVEVDGQRYRVLARQHLIWVSVGHVALREPSPGTPRFPAIYDSGFTDAFLIHRDQLRRFAGIHPQYLAAFDDFLRTRGRRIPLHAANVWLHPNRRGKRDEFSGAAPFLLKIRRGIGICDDSDGFPRLPLLGPLAFRPSGMEVCIDHATYHINARTPRRFWFFG